MYNSNSSSGYIWDVATQFFEDDEWRYEKIEDRGTLRMTFGGEHGTWICFAEIKEEQQQFLFYSRLLNKIPQDKRTKVAEFLTRANYGLKIGNFEMDFEDGEVGFKTSVDVKGGSLTTTMIKHMVYVNVLMMDKYFPGLMTVVYGGASPENAIDEIEGGTSPEDAIPQIENN